MPTLPSCLYVEDEKSDILLLEFAWARLELTNPLKTVKDGEEALAYLKGTGVHGDRKQYPIPGLVLLDLNLPRVSGMQVLEWIRQQPQFVSLPVVICTSSENPHERKRAWQLGANDYLIKPLGMEKILGLVRKLQEEWLT